MRILGLRWWDKTKIELTHDILSIVVIIVPMIALNGSMPRFNVQLTDNMTSSSTFSSISSKTILRLIRKSVLTRITKGLSIVKRTRKMGLIIIG